MNTNGNIQALLTELGKAHREGAFSSQPAAYPWTGSAKLQLCNVAPVSNRCSDAGSRIPSRTSRRVHWVWRTVPLAAAAAVALVVAGPSLFNSDRTRDIARNPAVVDPIGDSHTSGPVPGTIVVASNDCEDYNGDGQVNGLDVAPLMIRISNGESQPQDAERLARCLVGA